MLASLFPSSSSKSSISKRKLSKVFDPLDECVVAKEKGKKKATRVKPRRIVVVLLPDPSSNVPRAAKRRVLVK